MTLFNDVIMFFSKIIKAVKIDKIIKTIVNSYIPYILSNIFGSKKLSEKWKSFIGKSSKKIKKIKSFGETTQNAVANAAESVVAMNETTSRVVGGLAKKMIGPNAGIVISTATNNVNRIISGVARGIKPSRRIEKTQQQNITPSASTSGITSSQKRNKVSPVVVSPVVVSPVESDEYSERKENIEEFEPEEPSVNKKNKINNEGEYSGGSGTSRNNITLLESEYNTDSSAESLDVMLQLKEKDEIINRLQAQLTKKSMSPVSGAVKHMASSIFMTGSKKSKPTKKTLRLKKPRSLSEKVENI